MRIPAYTSARVPNTSKDTVCTMPNKCYLSGETYLEIKQMCETMSFLSFTKILS